MTNIASRSRSSIRTRVAAGVAAFGALCLATTVSFAAECPADKRVADGQGQKMGPTKPAGVADVVRASTDLSREPAAIKGRQFRLRQLDIQPGGVVPWHSHNERPAMIYVVSGEVVEYASNCTVPIMHKAGDVAPEKNGISHWWKNLGKKPAVLISVDLFPGEAQMDPHVM